MYYHCVQVNPVIEFVSSYGRSYSTEPVNELTHSQSQKFKWKIRTTHSPHFGDGKKRRVLLKRRFVIDMGEGVVLFLILF